MATGTFRIGPDFLRLMMFGGGAESRRAVLCRGSPPHHEELDTANGYVWGGVLIEWQLAGNQIIPRPFAFPTATGEYAVESVVFTASFPPEVAEILKETDPDFAHGRLVAADRIQDAGFEGLARQIRANRPETIVWYDFGSRLVIREGDRVAFGGRAT